tara:strand:- start:232 stop:612 length:381 start_codon:yes stop_codon:yes gene_type:complete
MNKRLRKKRVEEIANFIINNITLAETTTMVMERALESAEYIVENNLNPQDFKSPVARKKLAQKVKTHKGKSEVKIIEEEKIHKGKAKIIKEEKWYNNILCKLGIKKDRKEKEQNTPTGKLNTRKNK